MGATESDLHLNQFLTNVAIGYRRTGFIADLIAPVVPVAKLKDTYPIWSQADQWARPDTTRAPGTQAKTSVQGVSSDYYSCKNRAQKTPITLEMKANMDPVFVQGMYAGRAKYVTGLMQTDWEYRVAMQCFSITNVGTTVGVTTNWGLGGAVPLDNVFALMDYVTNMTGQKPNNLIFGNAAWNQFRRHASVRNIVFGSGYKQGLATKQQVAEIFEVEKVLVGEAFYNSAAEGHAASLQVLWGPHVWAYYAPANPSLEDPTWQYSFRWTQPGVPNMAAEFHPYDAKIKAEEVEVGYYQDEKIVGKNYAARLDTVNVNTTGGI